MSASAETPSSEAAPAERFRRLDTQFALPSRPRVSKQRRHCVKAMGTRTREGECGHCRRRYAELLRIFHARRGPGPTIADMVRAYRARRGKAPAESERPYPNARLLCHLLHANGYMEGEGPGLGRD